MSESTLRMELSGISLSYSVQRAGFAPDVTRVPRESLYRTSGERIAKSINRSFGEVVRSTYGQRPELLIKQLVRLRDS